MKDTEKEMQDERALAKFLFEGAMLKRIWRTGYAFLGKGHESVAAHSYGVALIALMLANDMPDIDMEKLLKLCIVHDLPEARTGDANAVNKLYVKIDEEAAVSDMIKGLDRADFIAKLISEYRKCKTPEAVLAHDADQLDMLFSLKEHMDTGSDDASRWIPFVMARLKTKRARSLAKALLKEHWASWWMERLLD